MRFFGGHSMVAPLRAVAVKRPEDAFRGRAAIADQWRALGYNCAPDLDRAAEEHRLFVSLLREAGAEVLYLPVDERTGMDSLYAHDPVLITDAGAVVFQMGKTLRQGEGPAFAEALGEWGVPILGYVRGPATAEAGDMVWLDSRTLLVGRGFRTNAAGVEALTALLRPLGVTVLTFHLPYASGPQDVLHLMSFMSMLDADLAVVHRPMLPVPLFELLTDRGIRLVDVAADEYPTLGCNILAVAPRQVIMIRGNPLTRSSLEAVGCTVAQFDGSAICIPGSGGPTCLTRPLWRTG
jgi:arginine deiminase